MEDIINIIISVSMVFGILVIQAITAKNKKKGQTTQQGDVLSSPFPEIEHEEPAQHEENEPSQTRTTWHDIIGNFSDILQDKKQHSSNTKKSMEEQRQHLQHNNLKSEVKETKHKTNDVSPKANTATNSPIDFSDPEEAKKAFIASLIFERKY